MDPTAPTPPARRRLALTLAAVFAAYLNPHLAVELASQVWACF